MLILTESDLRRVLEMRDVIRIIEEAFVSAARGKAIVPERLRIDVPEHDGVMLEMPAYLAASEARPGALGTKIVSVFARNSERGLDNIQGAYLLLDWETGVPLALMDGRFITAVRTAATSAVATKFMASPGRKCLAIFGAGVQARFHVEAMLAVADVDRVMLVSRSRDRVRALAETVHSTHHLPCEVVSAEQAASAADLICTCTSSAGPIFFGRLLCDGSHVNAVGAFTPSTRELDSEAVRRGRVIIDAESAAGREAGDILIPISEGAIDAAHVKGTLADVVSGKVAGRTSASEITIFKSCGLAIEDLATARLAYSRAVELGIGTRVAL